MLQPFLPKLAGSQSRTILLQGVQPHQLQIQVIVLKRTIRQLRIEGQFKQLFLTFYRRPKGPPDIFPQPSPVYDAIVFLFIQNTCMQCENLRCLI
ncbi:hypothetical protein D3C84_665510 [compost metagenome]